MSAQHLQRETSVAGLNDPVPHAYSHSVRSGHLLFLAGQCGTDDTGTAAIGFEAQARLALDRVRRILEQAGGTLRDIASMTVYLTDVRDAEAFVAIRRELFGADCPASALIGAAFLVPPGAVVEVQAHAVLGHHPDREPVSAGLREEPIT